MCAVKERNILTADDLTNDDRVARVLFTTGKLASFSEDNIRWKYSAYYSRLLSYANQVANDAIDTMMSST